MGQAIASSRPKAASSLAVIKSRFETIRHLAHSRFRVPARQLVPLQRIASLTVQGNGSWQEGVARQDRRFGATETRTSEGRHLRLSDSLQADPVVLDWVLWREATMTLIPIALHALPPVWDVGLYAGLTQQPPSAQPRLHRIWASIAPAYHRPDLVYFPAEDFPINAGSFGGTLPLLRALILWLRSLPIRVVKGWSPDTYLDALERWYHDQERPLTPNDLRILRALTERLDGRQVDLAHRLGIEQGTVSRILSRLAKRNFLRLRYQLNTSLLGVTPIIIEWHPQTARRQHLLRRQVGQFRYLETLLPGPAHRLFMFADVPTRRLDSLQAWADRLAAAWGMDRPRLHRVAEYAEGFNFDLYEPPIGWSVAGILDYVESTLPRLLGSAKEGAMLPIRWVPSTDAKATPDTPRLRLTPVHFQYLQRVCNPVRLCPRIRSTVALEARQVSPSVSDTTFRRWAEELDQLRLVGDPVGFGLLNVGLTWGIVVQVPGDDPDDWELPRRVSTALSRLPEFWAVRFREGGGLILARVPASAGAQVIVGVERAAIGAGLDLLVGGCPAIESMVYGNPISLANYDVDQGYWLWLKNTLPNPSPPAAPL